MGILSRLIGGNKKDKPLSNSTMTAPKKNTVYINSATAGVLWSLSRDGVEDHLIIVQSHLTIILLTAMQRGWGAKGFQTTANGAGRIELKVSPCTISALEARSLAVAISELHAHIRDNSTWIFHQEKMLVAFLEAGEFHVNRYPNELPRPEPGEWVICRINTATKVIRTSGSSDNDKLADTLIDDPVGFVGLGSMVSEVPTGKVWMFTTQGDNGKEKSWGFLTKS